MFSTPDDETVQPELIPRTQSESSGAGGGRNFVIAAGLSDGDRIDPTVITRDPPFWFPIVRSRAQQHFYKCLKAMPKERAINILSAVGMPPLCVLTLGIRWQLLPRDDFDYLDLQMVFEGAGHDVSAFGKSLDRLENRSLFYLYNSVGIDSAAMLSDAEIDDFKYQ